MTEPTIFDYTNRDYASLLASLLDTAALKFPEWTDRSENDVGRLLLELMAQAGDEILYYQDRIANEAFLASAVERRSVLDHAALLGYTLSTPAPASAVIRLRAANDGTGPLEIQPGARFATAATPTTPEVEFVYLPVTNAPLVVPRTGTGGEVTSELTAINATRIENENAGVSDGEAGQSLLLTQRPVLLPRDGDSQAYLSVEVDPGTGFERWERHATLLYSRSDDPHFEVRIDENDAAEIRFGDGTYGRIPPAGATVRVTYLIGGGVGGNVGAGTITVVKSGVGLLVTATNPLAASGGADRETIDHARRLAPLVFRSLRRAVTSSDYAALSENVPGVAHAIAVAPQWNYVDIYVVANGGGGPSDRLRGDILGYLQDKSMVGTLVSVRAPVFVTIDIAIEIGVRPTFYRDDVAHRVRTAVAALFQVDRLGFAQRIYLSQVYEAVQNQPGVEFSSVIAAGRRPRPGQEPEVVNPEGGVITLRSREFPATGAITVDVTSGGLS